MFNESNSVEALIRDLLSKRVPAGAAPSWQHIPGKDLPRAESDVLVEPLFKEALIRLNPEIAEDPERAEEVLYRLRAILLSVGTDGLVKSNEEFTSWLRGERSMPFGQDNQHTPVNLIDFENPKNNRYVIATQFTYRAKVERRFDVVLLVNGIPLVIGEAKTPSRPAVTWVDGAAQIHDDYEINVPAMFAPNVFSFATEGKTYRFGSVRMPLDIWAPWRDTVNGNGGLQEVKQAVLSMLTPETILRIVQHFTVFATDRQKRKIKLICRYQQYEAGNQIVDRVVAGRPKKGLIWHFQGSGKSLLMVFAAQRLRGHPGLGSPTVLIVVDRIDLDTQITGTFNATDVPNTVTASTRGELQKLLAQDVRKIIITTIHKFAEAAGVLNTRSNIIVMVDEAHRTQEGGLGRKMREALPNAFLFGLTGTPINKRDRNTFWAFGADEDAKGYMSRYSFEESIRDKATLPLHFEARLVEMRIDKAAIDEAFSRIAGDLSEDEQAELSKQAANLAVLMKSPERIRRIVKDIVKHYQDKVEPNGFKAQVVTFDRESCVLFKQAIDEVLPPEASDIVMSAAQGDPEEWKQYDRDQDEQERLLDRFRDSADPLKFLIVTSKLLAGFDAPILQVMYLDKPMKEHNLLQAICRVNRPYPNKTHGLIVDYLGVFDDVARALDFDEKAVQKVITNIDNLKSELPAAVAKCLGYFPGVDRSIAGYEGLLAAQECLPTNDVRDAFALDFSYLSNLWEALSPDPCLGPYAGDYRWLTQVYESVKPPSGTGKLLWAALGAKTVELIHQNVHVETVRDDLETLVMDEETLENFLSSKDPKNTVEIEFRISSRLRRLKNHPKFIELSKRLEDLKARHEKGLLTSIEFLKQLLALAKDVVAAEKETPPEEAEDRGKAALTDLFKEIRNADTPVVVERIVGDIDAIVKVVRFPGWQQTIAGEREVQKALRKTLLKYQLHREQELFDKAYAYIKQYY
jgi:type I restriction enzyme R subunit